MISALKEKLQIINQNLDEIKKNYPVKKIGIFGSFANGSQTKKSDIDIIVEFSKPIGFLKFIKLENFLSKKMNKKVDLTTKKALKPIIKKQILKEIIYA